MNFLIKATGIMDARPNGFITNTANTSLGQSNFIPRLDHC